jgi:Protein of unknown function (DUF3618)
MGEGAHLVTDDRTTGSWEDPDSSDDIDPEVEAKAAEIEATREEMTSTVEAIGEKLDPANIVEDAKETVREATVGKVETMAEDAGQMVGQAGANVQSAGSTIIETIKQNPIPAAMAGVALGWLVTHRATGNGSRGRWDQGDYRAYGSSGDRGWYAQGRQGAYAGDGGYDEQRAFDTRSSTGSRGWQGSDQGGVGEKVADVADSVGQTVGQMPDRIGEGAQGLGQQAQRVLHESPLAVGAAAVAVGAAIGLALPSTRVEQEVLGSTTSKLVDSVEQTATETMQQVRNDQGGQRADQTGQRDTTYSAETQAGL